jgi:hypothetical protein
MMSDQPLLVLFGDSLILDSVEASLADGQAFSVLRLRTAHPEVAERLQALAPALVIFDLDAPNLRSILPFLRAKPGVPLLGVDINGSTAVSLTCAHHLVENHFDLQEIIRTYIHTDADQLQIHRPVAEIGALSPAAAHGGA